MSDATVEKPVQVEEGAAATAPAAESMEIDVAAPAKSETETAPKVETAEAVPKAAGGSKFDASLLPQSDDPAEIRKQVCFFLPS